MINNKLKNKTLKPSLLSLLPHINFLVDMDAPTSIAVDPQLGKMFWTDAGETPSIETAWMDGSKRRRLLSDRMRHPAGLTIDHAMDHTLYWVDSKMNTIESIRPDGTNRIVVLKGSLGHCRMS